MERFKKLRFNCGWLLAAVLAAVFAIAASVPAEAGQKETSRFFETIKAKPPLLRIFLQNMPKGGDLHNHLGGSAYAESYLEWAAADGLCVDISVPKIVKNTDCGLSELPAVEVLNDDDMRRRVIDGLSMRSFVPTPGWSGHDQFFVTFARMKETDDRFWDLLAEVTNRAGQQNLGYMELMETGNTKAIKELLGAVKKADSDQKDKDAE
ncbi:MAG: hypothetical protein V3R73_03085, partial [Sphingomonadales bacterium]